MKHCLILLSYLITYNLAMAQDQVGIFESSVDIGNPKQAGSTLYDSNEQEYIIKGSGYNIWFGRDEFQFPYKKLTGDFILTANFWPSGDRLGSL